jgi:aryl-alcohol dehydrogenase-like predicted oxidoreductase
MFPVLRRTGIALMPYSPLDEGRIVEAGRTHDEAKTALIVEVDRVARQIRATRAQVLMAWVLSHPEATCVLTAAETPEQVEENYRAMEISLPAAAVAALNTASDAYAKSLGKPV